LKKNTLAKTVKHYLLSFLLIIGFISCSTYKYKITPENNDIHRLIRLKINYKDSKNKYSGKVIVLKQNNNKKIFILNPLGRVHFKLILNGNITTAIYVKKKKYWTGTFKKFIQKLWSINLSFDEFYSIIISGKISDKLKDKSINIKINSRDDNKTPKTIVFTRDNTYLKFKVLKNQEKSGKIDFHINKKLIKKVSLRELFEK